MRALVLAAFFCCVSVVGAPAAGIKRWKLERSTVSYIVKHPFHRSRGESTTVRGRGKCDGERCKFLVAAPIVSFVSKDRNRDIRMLKAMKAGAYPLVSVSANLPDDLSRNYVIADLEVELAGVKSKYPQVRFEIEDSGGAFYHVSGAVSIDIREFGIDAPMFFMLPISASVSIEIDAVWRILPEGVK